MAKNAGAATQEFFDENTRIRDGYFDAAADLAYQAQLWAKGQYKLEPGYSRCDKAKLYACGVAKQRGAMCATDPSICGGEGSPGSLVCHDIKLRNCFATTGFNGGGACVNVPQVCKDTRPGAAQ